MCASLARRFRSPLEARGFGLAALQDPRAQALLNLPPAELLREMRLATAEGEILGGARAVVYLARRIWWAWPLHALSRIPGGMRVLDAGYRWFAVHRTCTERGCTAAVRTREPEARNLKAS